MGGGAGDSGEIGGGWGELLGIVMEKNAEEYFETITCKLQREEERGVSGEMSNRLLLERRG